MPLQAFHVIGDRGTRVERVFVAPGNAGTAIDAENVPIKETDFPELIKFAKQNKIGLTVVGPEAPLAAGIVDLFRSKGLRIFGPTQRAAQLESSKDFAKAFMKRHGVPTARFVTCDSLDEALDAL